MKNCRTILITNNIRSAHNVGSLLRTADAAGVEKVIFTGITPYPKRAGDTRLPHIAEGAHKQISKTALGAEATVKWEYFADIAEAINVLKRQNYQIVALEQAPNSTPLFNWQPKFPVALIIGHEVTGVEKSVLELCDQIVEIPQYGSKESLNVSVAAGVALYHLLSLQP